MSHRQKQNTEELDNLGRVCLITVAFDELLTGYVHDVAQGLRGEHQQEVVESGEHTIRIGTVGMKISMLVLDSPSIVSMPAIDLAQSSIFVCSPHSLMGKNSGLIVHVDI